MPRCYYVKVKSEFCYFVKVKSEFVGKRSVSSLCSYCAVNTLGLEKSGYVVVILNRTVVKLHHCSLGCSSVITWNGIQVYGWGNLCPQVKPTSPEVTRFRVTGLVYIIFTRNMFHFLLLALLLKIFFITNEKLLLKVLLGTVLLFHLHIRSLMKSFTPHPPHPRIGTASLDPGSATAK